MTTSFEPSDSGPEVLDSQPFVPHYGDGGVPWFLLLKYVCFLAFFTWYVLEYQLPDYLEQGPGRGVAQPRTASAAPVATPAAK